MKTIKKINLYIVMLFVSASLFMSCERATLDLFDQEPSVYFHWIENDGRANPFQWAVDVKFNLIAGDTDTVRIPVRVMGALADYDRPFAVRVRDDIWGDFIAREGVHYRILHDLSYIPANSRQGYATVLALRAEAPEDKVEVGLFIRLVPNQHFVTSFETVINNTTQRWERSVLDFRIFISDTLVRPWIWQHEHTVRFWGRFSARKYELILHKDIGIPSRLFWERLAPWEGRWVGPPDAEPVAFRLRDTLQRNYCRSRLFQWPDSNWNELIVDEFGNMLEDVIDFWETFPAPGRADLDLSCQILLGIPSGVSPYADTIHTIQIVSMEDIKNMR